MRELGTMESKLSVEELFDQAREVAKTLTDGEHTYGQALMATVVNKRTYEAWAFTLDSAESAKLAKIEKRVSAKLDMPTPKGMKEWRLFVTTVMEAYAAQLSGGARPSLLKGAHRRHAEYLASIVIASNCGICGPRDRAMCGVCYPADSNGYALVEPGKSIDESTAEMLSEPDGERQAPDAVDAYAKRHHVAPEPIREALAEVRAEAMATALQELPAGYNWQGNPPRLISPSGQDVTGQPVKYNIPSEHVAVALSADVIAKSLSGPQAFALAWAAGIVLDSGLPLRPVMDQLRAMGLTSESEPVTDTGWAVLAALDVVEGQSGRPTGVTRMNVRTVIEMRHPRVKGFNRRKPSLARRGWK